MNKNLIEISLKDIQVREDKLRGPQFDTASFKNLVASISAIGLLNPITVIPDPQNKGKYLLIDGQQRLAAHERINAETIQALVDTSDIDPDTLNIQQIQANLHRVETKHSQYAQAFKRLLKHPKYRLMSHAEFLAAMGIAESPAWLRNQLQLTNLIPEFQELLDKGSIPLTTAYFIGSLDGEDQAIFLDKAQTENVDTLVHEIEEFKREKKAVAKGESVETIDPLKSAKLRKLTDIKDKILTVENALVSNKDDKYTAGLLDGIMWAVSLDAETVAAKEKVKNESKKKADEIVKRRRELMKARRDEINSEIENQIKQEGLFSENN